MSVCRKLPDGTIQKIAGHTILLDANASEVRQGRWNLVSTTSEWVVQNITFTDPMPDNDYIVIIESDNQSWAAQPGPYRITNKTTTGFTLASYNMANASSQVNMNIAGTYTAFKPVKIEGYTALQNKINNPDNTPTIDSMNLVTSDGVARAIENASAVWKGTKAEWNALPATTKIKYDLAVLIDTQLIKSVDRTDGTDSDVADLTSVWTGTQAEWDAMSTADKNKWDKALIKDDEYVTTQAVIVKRDSAVAVADWAADTSHSGMNYRCDISVPGVTADYTPDVRFAYAQATSGNFSCVSDSGTDIVSIYAVNAPTTAFTIPAIICTLMGV